MKYIHSIKISVFSYKEEDEEKITKTLLSLIPFDLEKEKIELKIQDVKGFNENDIKISEIILSKQRHAEGFFKFMLSKLNDKQKKLLIEQKESRLDDNLNFFIRLDKEALLNNEFLITDSGNCFHIRISIAAFPAKREEGLKIVQKLFNINQS